ncbi:nucleotide cyclase [Haematococcus lacustris]
MAGVRAGVRGRLAACRWMAMDFQRPALEFYFRPGGGVNANMAVPITVANVAPDDLFGMSRDVTFCPSDRGCYNATERVRFWGLIIAVVTLDDLFSGHASHLRVLSQEGLEYQVLVPASVVSATGLPSTDLVVAHSPRAQVGAEQRADVVTASATLPTGDAWSLRVWRPRGNTPRWRTPLLAVMPLVCLILAAEVFVVLVSGFRHGQLVRAMLPPRAARCLAVGQEYAEAFDGVTILFTDICSYTTISSELTARQVVALLSGLYDRFDTLCEKHGMWKVETVGDCWMAASGAYPRLAPREAALRAARLALDMIQVAEGFTSEDGRRVQIRVGLASGPVFASVISHKMPHVALIGDTTNVASRMESSCEPMRIHVAGSTAALLKPSCTLPVRLAPCPDATAFPPPDQPDPWLVTPGTSGVQPCGPLPPAGRPGCELASHSSMCVHLELARQVSSSSSSGLGAQLPNPAQGSTMEVADPASGRTLFLEARGPQNIKGKGLMHTFWLSGGPALPA